MLQAKNQYHRSSGSGEEDFDNFCLIWALPLSLSCEIDHLFKHYFPLP